MHDGFFQNKNNGRYCIGNLRVASNIIAIDLQFKYWLNADYSGLIR